MAPDERQSLLCLRYRAGRGIIWQFLDPFHISQTETAKCGLVVRSGNKPAQSLSINQHTKNVGINMCNTCSQSLADKVAATDSSRDVLS